MEEVVGLLRFAAAARLLAVVDFKGVVNARQLLMQLLKRKLRDTRL